MENKEIETLKKIYGENFARLCRGMFPTILETEGKLTEIITGKFAPNKFLYEDILEQEKEEKFRDYIVDLYYQSFEMEEPKELVQVDGTPFELMRKAGYTLSKCETNEDIQNFSKYFQPNENLCTFKYEDRIDKCLVFFAVKDGAENLIREDFKNPQRQDEYGTSVISIQFSKGVQNYISIKNRYNHAVKNPDSTFSNDLDSIIPGLTGSFTRE